MKQPPLYAVIDVETTGGDPRRHRVTEVAVVVTDGEKVLDEFCSLVNPERPIPHEITRITGINNDLVKDAPKFYEVARKIVEITEGAVFVAHNARFDYGFITQEFRRLGYTFQRKQLCTVRLSRRLMPGLRSYSLGNLCKHLRIENLQAHRALSDTRATVELFHQLLDIQRQPAPDDRSFSLSIRQAIDATKIPPKLDPAELEALPSTPGVYYFHDENGNILYVGKSTAIRKRVLSHFSAAHKSARGLRMIGQIAHLSFTETGNELIALLLENEEIKRLQPNFNRAQRRKKLNFGIYEAEPLDGYRRLEVRKLDPKSEWPIAAYASRGHAEGALKRRMEDHGLCLHLCGVVNCHRTCFYRHLKLCNGAGVGEESTEVYNERVEGVVDYLRYGASSFLVISPGRHAGERSVVAVERGRYQGWGYFEPECTGNDLGLIRQAVVSKSETPDVRQILQLYVRQHPQERKVLPELIR